MSFTQSFTLALVLKYGHSLPMDAVAVNQAEISINVNAIPHAKITLTPATIAHSRWTFEDIAVVEQAIDTKEDLLLSPATITIKLGRP